MKKTKSIISIFLALIMLMCSFSISVFAEAPKITNIKWNDDYSVEFNFDGASQYSWSVYVNNYMIWGFGTTYDTKISREKMVPYMTELANDAIKEEGFSGNVSFDFVIYAKNSNGNTISLRTIVSKSLNIEDVAAGKLSPDSEQWKYYPVSTTDKTKLTKAFYAAYDPDKAKIQSALSSSGLTYNQYIGYVIDNACKDTYFTFIGTLAQAMRFGSVYSSYAYTDITLAQKDKLVSEVNITLTAPKHGQSLNAYAKGSIIKSKTEGVTAKISYDVMGLKEYETKKFVKKFYAGNKYEVEFSISFAEGYAPAEDIVVKVNGKKADWVSKDYGFNTQINGYYCSHNMVASGNLFQKIITFFHNLLTK